jgi:hypothetical protein
VSEQRAMETHTAILQESRVQWAHVTAASQEEGAAAAQGEEVE